ncbi:hypothetical protein Zmor_015198 [Zophobas morio]|uniref:Uncharacterized protein n=1 Tax=Zophobas morio TaxID=2755281 RepID=A0AA38IDQ6_9CUCU|nr:hypothetical protein Zmor_015198 [Zophobas morio]
MKENAEQNQHLKKEGENEPISKSDKKHKFYERTKNLTNTKFTEMETRMLNKGPKYAIASKKWKRLELLVVDTDREPYEHVKHKSQENYKKCGGTIEGFNKHQLEAMNPTIPRLYGMIKVHKDNLPIKPVISLTNFPAHKLNKWLNKVIKHSEF